jgi:hypothetical protein
LKQQLQRFHAQAGLRIFRFQSLCHSGKADAMLKKLSFELKKCPQFFYQKQEILTAACWRNTNKKLPKKSMNSLKISPVQPVQKKSRLFWETAVACFDG